MDCPDWKRVPPHLRGSKAFWSDMTKCKIEKHAGQCERGSQEVVRTTSCWRTQQRLSQLVLSLPLSLLARSALRPPSSAWLVAKIWEGQATPGSWQLSKGLLQLDVDDPMVPPTRHPRLLRASCCAARLPKSLLIREQREEEVEGLHAGRNGWSLEDGSASQEELDKLQNCVDRNIMGSARS